MDKSILIKNKIVFVFLLAIFFLTTLFISTNFASADAQIEQESEIKIAHITDLHYFAYDKAYLADQNTENYKDTDFYLAMSKDTKLIKQSGTLLNASIQAIIMENPDYLVVSGDITSNGELDGHIDVANALRYLQNSVRANSNPNFQVFVIPGNHDLYNNRASMYINEENTSNNLKPGQRITSQNFITTAQAFREIYHGLGYPDKSINDLEKTTVGQYMLNYYKSCAINPNAYTSQYIPSNNATNIVYTYYSDTIGFPNKNNRCLNTLSYLARITDKNYVFTMIDGTDRNSIGEVTNYQTSEYIYHNQATGGILTEAFKNWLGGELEADVSNNKTIIGSCHFNLLPHYTMEENYTKDFTLYNWEESARFLADKLKMRYIFTGHMHSSDVAYFNSYDGNQITDFETGSTVSLNSPIRYTKITRYRQGSKVVENANSVIVKINSLENINTIQIDYSYSESRAKFNDVTDLQLLIGAEIYDKIVERLLDSYLNANLEYTLINLIKGLNLKEIKILGTYSKDIENLAAVVIHELLYDFDYNIDGIEANNLFEFVKKAVYKTDTLNMVIYSEGDQVFTLEDILIYAYKAHLSGGEPEFFEDSTVIGRACIKAQEDFKNGSVVERLINGLLNPILYVNNSLIRQLLVHEFDVTSCQMASSSFNGLIGIFISQNSENHPKNNGGILRVKDILEINRNGLLFKTLMSKLDNSTGELIVEILDKGLVEWAEEQLDKYLTDSFYTGIGGILKDTFESFALDASYDGNSITYEKQKTKESDYTQVKYENNSIYTYSGEPLSIEYNAPTHEDGRLPSLVTATFGDDAATSQNFKWYTNYEIGGKFLYREIGASEYEEAAVTTTYKAIATPLIDLGLFATTTATSLETKNGEVEITLENKHLRETEGLHNSVKFAAIHNVSLTNLKPNTKYEYLVIGTYKGQEFINEEAPYSFKTAPRKGDNAPFRFLVISDIQGTIMSSYELAGSAIRSSFVDQTYDFIINCGDVTDNGKNIKQWHYALDNLSDIFLNSSVVVAAGNHEKNEGALANYYNFGGIGNKETQDLTTGVYCSFDYGRTHFVVLNTNDYDTNGLCKAQYDWLVADLQSAKEDKDIDKIIVCMHKSLYSVGSHSQDKEIIAMRKQLVPLFYNMGVSLVLAGHDHTFSTTKPLDANGSPIRENTRQEDGSLIVNENGVIYMTVGTIADKYYEYRKNEDLEHVYDITGTHFSQLNSPHATMIESADNMLKVSTQTLDNQPAIASSEKSGAQRIGKLEIALIVCGAVIVLLGAGIIIFFIIKNKKKKAAKDIDLNQQT